MKKLFVAFAIASTLGVSPAFSATQTQSCADKNTESPEANKKRTLLEIEKEVKANRTVTTEEALDYILLDELAYLESILKPPIKPLEKLDCDLTPQ
jgi:hypothetical protein